MFVLEAGTSVFRITSCFIAENRPRTSVKQLHMHIKSHLSPIFVHHIIAYLPSHH